MNIIKTVCKSHMEIYDCRRFHLWEQLHAHTFRAKIDLRCNIMTVHLVDNRAQRLRSRIPLAGMLLLLELLVNEVLWMPKHCLPLPMVSLCSNSEDTTYLSHRTQRNQGATHLEASSTVVSFCCVGSCYADYWKRKVMVDLSCLWTM